MLEAQSCPQRTAETDVTTQHLQKAGGDSHCVHLPRVHLPRTPATHALGVGQHVTFPVTPSRAPSPLPCELNTAVLRSFHNEMLLPQLSLSSEL